MAKKKKLGNEDELPKDARWYFIFRREGQRNLKYLDKVAARNTDEAKRRMKKQNIKLKSVDFLLPSNYLHKIGD